MDAHKIIELHLSEPTNFNILTRLANIVSEHEWNSLVKIGITPSNYSTHKILETSSLDKNGFHVEGFMIVGVPESLILPDDGFYSYTDAEKIPKDSIECLKEAFDVLLSVESLHTVINTLVKNLHILRSQIDEIDVSYSLPNIPFSIFVSLPVSRHSNDYLRVAEGVLHEAMHLQLSLIEKITPLVQDENDRFYSPWKGEKRSIQGILHALYVFRIIRRFYQLLIKHEHIQDPQFCIKRINEIETEINLFKNLGKLDSLTNSGNNFIQHLISL